MPLPGYAGIQQQAEQVKDQVDTSLVEASKGKAQNAYFAASEAVSALTRMLYMIQRGEDAADAD